MAGTEDLVKRLRDLEASHAKLREQLGVVLRDGGGRPESEGPIERGDGGGGSGVGVMIPGCFHHGPYQSVLRHLGHALHVCRPDTGEIIYWFIDMLMKIHRRI